MHALGGRRNFFRYAKTDLARGSLPESLLEHHPAVVIQGHRRFLLCTCKNQATALGKATSKASFEKERCGSIGTSPLLHTRALLGQAVPLRAVLRLGSRVQGVLATRGLRPKNGSRSKRTLAVFPGTSGRRQEEGTGRLSTTCSSPSTGC